MPVNRAIVLVPDAASISGAGCGFGLRISTGVDHTTQDLSLAA